MNKLKDYIQENLVITNKEAENKIYSSQLTIDKY